MLKRPSRAAEANIAKTSHDFDLKAAAGDESAARVLFNAASQCHAVCFAPGVALFKERYADDMAFCASSLADLQLMFDTCWMVTRARGEQEPTRSPPGRPGCATASFIRE